ncbi:MAG: tRNA (adenosine(37)-N6)-dimethylallyltransferase MiaA [Alphaproteobacteria bacterium]|nr:tRNA (adenosine(37)-N6)-dimethylallyltransferase MiaA [Alphaproteobacteria bacterium]
MKCQSYIVTGPTASGKSDFAHALARRVRGVIINCDSVQVYRGIENLSASPFAASPQSTDNRAQITDKIDGVPYRLFSITDGDKPLSAGLWAQMARREYDAAIAAGRPPVFVGGAGFYLKALLDGMSPIPAVPSEARNAAREFASRDLAAAYEYLQKVDAAWADKINKNDRQRIVRGIEVFQATGKPLSEWQGAPRVPTLPAPPVKILISPDRELLRERIAARMPALAKSVLVEVGDILKKNWSPALPIMKADGIAEISRFLSGEISFDEAVDLWRIKICNHNMKHQYTWFKTNFHPDIILDHIPTDEDLDLILAE